MFGDLALPFRSSTTLFTTDFMKHFLFVLLLGLSTCYTFAQSNQIAPADLAQLEELEDTLGLLSFLIIKDSLPENRFAATKKMIPTLVKALKFKNSFHYPFEQMRTVSIQYPADSTFRVFTWQLYVDVDDYRYYGAIQMNTPDLKLYPLIDRSRKVAAEEEDILQPENWFGALYYNIHQFEAPEGRKYLLFGFNGLNLFNKKKFIDVLQFDEKGASFGAPVFVEVDSSTMTQKVRSRIVKEYSAESSIRMNYDETFGLIMFDHLITMGGSYGQGPTSVPDGSYEGYELGTDGRWYWIDKVFNQVSEKPPMEYPILGKEKRDLFGNDD